MSHRRDVTLLMAYEDFDKFAYNFQIAEAIDVKVQLEINAKKIGIDFIKNRISKGEEPEIFNKDFLQFYIDYNNVNIEGYPRFVAKILSKAYHTSVNSILEIYRDYLDKSFLTTIL